MALPERVGMEGQAGDYQSQSDLDVRQVCSNEQLSQHIALK